MRVTQLKQINVFEESFGRAFFNCEATSPGWPAFAGQGIGFWGIGV